MNGDVIDQCTYRQTNHPDKAFRQNTSANGSQQTYPGFKNMKHLSVLQKFTDMLQKTMETPYFFFPSSLSSIPRAAGMIDSPCRDPRRSTRQLAIWPPRVTMVNDQIGAKLGSLIELALIHV